MIKNKGTKKLAKLPPDFERRAAAGFVARRRLAGTAAADLFLKVVVLRVRVAIFFSVVGGQWLEEGRSDKKFLLTTDRPSSSY
ncbi:MAG TPA: hypothetical protein VGC97_16800 [Pyrinomonadaceae bacterium]|jgi:hypothetical protein